MSFAWVRAVASAVMRESLLVVVAGLLLLMVVALALSVSFHYAAQ